VHVAPELLARTELRVSPQIIAHSALLELSSEELEEQVEEEADRNPALKLTRRCGPVITTGDFGPPEADAADYDLSSWLPAPTSARDDILWQFRAAAPRHLIPVGELIISALDDHGYLRGDLFEIAEVAGVSVEAAEAALAVIQRLEPPGLAARSLSECLLLQIEFLETVRKLVPPPKTHQFIARCLEAGPGEMRRWARDILGLSEKEIGQILDFIRTHCHPYPASLVECSGPPSRLLPAPPVVPDVAIEVRDERVYITVPLSERIQLRIDAIYQRIDEELRHRRRLSEHERTIRERVRAARELIRLLQRRQETLALVAETIVKHQQEYFATGDPQRLVPLNQKDIAHATGLHESTVCRAVKNKYVLMPDGVLLPLQVFFDESLPAKVELHRLVSQEPPDKPLSDEELAAELAARGYHLARRTVTKYRLQLGIPSVHKRRSTKAERTHASRASSAQLTFA
jgi:RNA polymerase sigma-54 factor